MIAELEKNGLKQGEDGLEVYVMCEIPRNVILGLSSLMASSSESWPLRQSAPYLSSWNLGRMKNAVIGRLFEVTSRRPTTTSLR